VYSVKIFSPVGNITLYLSFETYFSAVQCIATLEATEPGRYSPDVYFEVGELTREPKGEVINSRTIESDYALVYYDKVSD
jgi:hypothetical protein